MTWIEQLRWSLGVGDPTILGWSVTLGYFLAAALALRAGRWARSQPSQPRLELFWFGATAILVALGLNKQLDLHILITDIGRIIGRTAGWYENRRAVQRQFVLLLCAGMLLATVCVGYYFRGILRNCIAAMAGFGLLVAYLIYRAANFHHVLTPDAGASTNQTLIVMFEPLGLLLIAANSLYSLRRRRKSCRKPAVSTH